MKTVTLLSGQTYIEEEQGDSFTLIPAHKWIEEQVAVEEIALAFELLGEHKHDERFHLFISWLMEQFREKYGEKWPRLFDNFLNSPRAGQEIAKMNIDDILNEERR